MTHEDYKELLPASALTALDREDARALAAHLESCADCRLEMDEWQKTAAFLALEAKPLAPLPQLREQILAAVHADDQSAKSTDRPAVGVAQTAVKSIGSRVPPFDRAVEQRPRNIWTSLGSFGAIAATVILAALIISLVVLWQQNRANQKQLAHLTTELRQAKAQLDHKHAVVQLLTSPGAQMARLAGTDVAPGAHAMLAYDKSGHAMLMAEGLPAAPQGKAYQLWYIKGGKPMPGKMLITDATGTATVEDQIPAAALSGAEFAVTLEPSGGMPSPTGAIYLRSAA